MTNLRFFTPLLILGFLISSLGFAVDERVQCVRSSSDWMSEYLSVSTKGLNQAAILLCKNGHEHGDIRCLKDATVWYHGLIDDGSDSNIDRMRAVEFAVELCSEGVSIQCVKDAKSLDPKYGLAIYNDLDEDLNTLLELCGSKRFSNFKWPRIF